MPDYKSVLANTKQYSKGRNLRITDNALYSDLAKPSLKPSGVGDTTYDSKSIKVSVLYLSANVNCP